MFIISKLNYVVCSVFRFDLGLGQSLILTFRQIRYCCANVISAKLTFCISVTELINHSSSPTLLMCTLYVLSIDFQCWPVYRRLYYHEQGDLRPLYANSAATRSVHVNCASMFIRDMLTSFVFYLLYKSNVLFRVSGKKVNT